MSLTRSYTPIFIPSLLDAVSCDHFTRPASFTHCNMQLKEFHTFTTIAWRWDFSVTSRKYLSRFKPLLFIDSSPHVLEVYDVSLFTDSATMSPTTMHSDCCGSGSRVAGECDRHQQILMYHEYGPLEMLQPQPLLSQARGRICLFVFAIAPSCYKAHTLLVHRSRWCTCQDVV